MSDANMRMEANRLYLSWTKMHTEFWMENSTPFYQMPEEEKPLILANLYTFVVEEVMNNAYVIAHKDIFDTALEFTQYGFTFFGMLYNSQINPSTWPGMPAHIRDGEYEQVWSKFFALRVKVSDLLRTEGYLPQP